MHVTYLPGSEASWKLLQTAKPAVTRISRLRFLAMESLFRLGISALFGQGQTLIVHMVVPFPSSQMLVDFVLRLPVWVWGVAFCLSSTRYYKKSTTLMNAVDALHSYHIESVTEAVERLRRTGEEPPPPTAFSQYEIPRSLPKRSLWCAGRDQCGVNSTGMITSESEMSCGESVDRRCQRGSIERGLRASVSLARSCRNSACSCCG